MGRGTRRGEVEPTGIGDGGFVKVLFSYTIVASLIKLGRTKPGSMTPGFIGVDELNGSYLMEVIWR